MIKKLPNGNLLVPCRVMDDETGTTGDSVEEISQETSVYKIWLKFYKQQEENENSG